MSVLASLIHLSLGLVQSNSEQQWLMLLLVIQVSALLIVLLILSHCFALLASHDLSLNTTLLYAAVLVCKYKIQSIGILSTLILFAFLVSITRLALLLICPGSWAVLSANSTLALVHR